ncbi:MAG: DNA polymerase III subunit gamma/tau [Ignavibacteria bacterium]|nr:DNA polymerase III subunit gamma/tau [Ignavibacteria bacterium]MBT8382664.1 DNA polymerase III subunit gamma/tau [Ignavibacteria bacterium]MBT8391221.1 DNA polymerase III subunit gamma/tau [Ignavibacteria bacterium]NNJ54432.1 DNA polymerase III subunit gamma/tau [Ignavibacteriaceae bacterium]NNL22448.1 DNA polymerase III subunit gamma/tau [Ignavibacteriaceae bacterium]
MNFVVTARKWRPQRFDEVVGQEHITATIKNAIKENRIPHAYLFTGPRGVGKTTTARILAKALNCENQKDAEPCNKCSNCVAIQNSQLMDIIEIDGASNRGIDEVRTLRDSVKYAPTKSKYKVYIIDEVHMLTRESFNAFLKTLEEPPEYTIFIFATTDAHKVPLTIISRCQRFDFRRIQLDKIKETLKMIAKEEKIEIDDKTLTTIAKKADGALRDAESYFDQVVSFCQGKIDSAVVAQMLNLINEEVFFKISDAVLDKNFKAVFEVTNTIYENGWDFTDFLDGLIEHFRNILSVLITNSSNGIESAENYKKKYLEYTDKFSESDVLRLLSFLNKSHQEIRFSQNQKIKIEIILSHLIALEKTNTISEVISSLNSSDTPKFIGEQKEDYSGAKLTGKKKALLVNNSKPQNFSQQSSTKIVNSPPTSEIKSAILAELNFDGVVDKWQKFVDFIREEKGLTLAPALQSFNLISLSGSQLEFSTFDEQDKKLFEMHENYIEKKSEEFFGRRLKFNWITKKTQIKKSDQKITAKSQTSADPFEEVILNELGGQKIQ